MTAYASHWVQRGAASVVFGLSSREAKRWSSCRAAARDVGRAAGSLPPFVTDPWYGSTADPAPDLDDGDPPRRANGSLLDHLRGQVDRLTDELAEARTEMRGVRYEAECLRVEAGRAQVFAALIEAERTRSAELRGERDRLADELVRCRRPWLQRVLRTLIEAFLWPRQRI